MELGGQIKVLSNLQCSKHSCLLIKDNVFQTMLDIAGIKGVEYSTQIPTAVSSLASSSRSSASVLVMF